MNKSANGNEVEIHGKKYRFRGGDPEFIAKCAEYINSQMAQFDTKTVDLHTLFSVVAMKITEQYFHQLEQNNQVNIELEKATRQLEEFLLSDT